MEDKITKRFYFLLRLFRANGAKPLYAYQGRHSREWYTTEDRSEAEQFPNRSEARQRTRAVNIKHRLAKGWFWEVVRVDETIVTSYEETFLVSNAPPLVSLARAAVE